MNQGGTTDKLLFVLDRSRILSGTFLYFIGNPMKYKRKDAQLAERKMSLCDPLARLRLRGCAILFKGNPMKYKRKDAQLAERKDYVVDETMALPISITENKYAQNK